MTKFKTLIQNPTLSLTLTPTLSCRFQCERSRLVPEDNNPSFIEYSGERALVPYVPFGKANSSVFS